MLHTLHPFFIFLLSEKGPTHGFGKQAEKNKLLNSLISRAGLGRLPWEK